MFKVQIWIFTPKSLNIFKFGSWCFILDIFGLGSLCQEGNPKFKFGLLTSKNSNMDPYYQKCSNMIWERKNVGGVSGLIWNMRANRGHLNEKERRYFNSGLRFTKLHYQFSLSVEFSLENWQLKILVLSQCKCNCIFDSLKLHNVTFIIVTQS